MKIHQIIIVILFSITSNFVFGFATGGGNDTIRPEVGKPMPDFELEITHFKSKKVTMKDFRGKWLFLDFWSTGCLTCIQSFPFVNSVSKEFKDQLNWVLVGKCFSRYENPKALFEKIRAKKHLEIPVAYDSVYSERWGIEAVPHIIMIDPEGIVRFITDGRDMSKAKIKALLGGENVNLFDITIPLKVFDPELTNKSDTLGGDNLVYRSVLKKWNNEKAGGGVPVNEFVKWPPEYQKQGYNFSMVPLTWLYSHAYLGRSYWDYDNPDHSRIYRTVIVEVKSSSAFIEDSGGAGRYCYSLVLPTEGITEEFIKRAMQDDLKAAFPFKASIEERDMQVWKLIAQPGAIEKLKTKGREKYVTPGIQIMGFEARNWENYNLIGYVSFYLEGQFTNPYIPFVDDTGLVENFDLTMKADMSNMEEVNKELRKQGLELVKGTRRMKVVVVKDP